MPPQILLMDVPILIIAGSIIDKGIARKDKKSDNSLRSQIVTLKGLANGEEQTIPLA